ncbi:MAG: tol-pal system protein YbgF [Candidatus Edwardsbacteria bacterium]|nr:tol-pal system protein YbgF [Candidatus Edwardsbacteria bacterium]
MRQIAVLAAAVLMAVGCGVKREYLEVRRQLDYLEQSQKELAVRTARIDSVSRTHSDILFNLQADLAQLAAGLARRLDAADQRAEDLGARGRPAAAGGDTASAIAPSDAARRLYDAAYLDVVRGSYPLAISAFREFLNQYPGHPLSDNARYWIGECLYAQKQHAAALDEFRATVADYPGQDKEPAARYKAGLCLQELGRPVEARREWEELARRFPKSPEAKLAKGRLAELR